MQKRKEVKKEKCKGTCVEEKKRAKKRKRKKRKESPRVWREKKKGEKRNYIIIFS